MWTLLPLLRRDALQTPPHPESVRCVARLGVVISGLVWIWIALPPDDRFTQLVSSYGVILGGLGLLTDLTMGLIRCRPQRWHVIRRMTRLGVVLLLVRVLGPFMVAWAETDPAAALAFGLALLILHAFVFSGPSLANSP